MKCAKCQKDIDSRLSFSLCIPCFTATEGIIDPNFSQARWLEEIKAENEGLEKEREFFLEKRKKLQEENTELYRRYIEIISENSKLKLKCMEYDAKITDLENRNLSNQGLYDDTIKENAELREENKRLMADRDNYKKLYEKEREKNSDLRHDMRQIIEKYKPPFPGKND